MTDTKDCQNGQLHESALLKLFAVTENPAGVAAPSSLAFVDKNLVHLSSLFKTLMKDQSKPLFLFRAIKEAFYVKLEYLLQKFIFQEAMDSQGSLHVYT